MKDVVLHCSIFFKWNKLVRVRVRVRNASEALNATFSETQKFQEELERDERRKNIIIYKAVEQEGTAFEESKKHDKQLIENILREIERPQIEVTD